MYLRPIKINDKPNKENPIPLSIGSINFLLLQKYFDEKISINALV